jgi:hypothetical protein
MFQSRAESCGCVAYVKMAAWDPACSLGPRARDAAPKLLVGRGLDAGANAGEGEKHKSTGPRLLSG